MATQQITIEKLVFGGQGLGRTEEGKVALVWNALPGETVEFEVVKKRREYLEGIATVIHHPSSDRVEPQEDHYLSSSPWQMMSWEAENTWKQKIAIETYARNGGLEFTDMPIVADDTAQFGYRNKIEFSFTEREDGLASLAFFKRGGKARIPLTESLLAEPVINRVAQHVLEWVNTQPIPMRSLKSIIVRSNGKGQAIAALFIKDKLPFETHVQLTDELIGYQLYYSTHKSPASVPTQLMYSKGQDFLTTTLAGTELQFGLLSFFQVHIPMFEKALDTFAQFLDPDSDVLDMYSGVGAISLPLRTRMRSGFLVDNNEQAIAYAQENIGTNQAINCSAQCTPAEKITDMITADKIVILDPPRAGLHKNVVRKINEVLPKRVVYLSCNLATQARDVGELTDNYTISHHQIFNFFPRTPHIEGLLVLDRKK